MRSARNRAGTAGATDQTVPRGRARAEALAAIAAEARARILAVPSPLDSLTPEDIARYRACDLPEILGSGPMRRNPPVA
jgi:hypothetical protein